jgi:peptide/nickel transport system permease protein
MESPTAAVLPDLAGATGYPAGAPRRVSIGWLAGQRQMQLGLTIVLGMLVIALIAPLIAPFDPERATSDVLAAPNATHPFGTDISGFDVLSRTLYAPRVDILIAFSSTVLAMVVGVPLGIVAGYRRGLQSEVMSRGFDIIQAFPFFILALVLLGIFGPSVRNLILVVAFVNAPIYFRLMKSQAQMLKGRQFIEAARVAGCRDRDLMFRHILPNSLTPALAQMSVTIAWSIILTAGVSFVGAGVRAPTPEWGVMIANGAAQMQTGQWWSALFPGLVLAISVIGYALVGNAITDVMDPRKRNA